MLLEEGLQPLRVEQLQPELLCSGLNHTQLINTQAHRITHIEMAQGACSIRLVWVTFRVPQGSVKIILQH